jgi:hypothetical protein
MDMFLDTLDYKLKNKNKKDNLSNKYLNDINNKLLIPLLSKLDMCEELIKFNEIFNLPYNENEYMRVFEEIINKIQGGTLFSKTHGF